MSEHGSVHLVPILFLSRKCSANVTQCYRGQHLRDFFGIAILKLGITCKHEVLLLDQLTKNKQNKNRLPDGKKVLANHKLRFIFDGMVLHVHEVFLY